MIIRSDYRTITSHSYRLVSGQSGCRAEICQFNVTRAVDQNILWFNISATQVRQQDIHTVRYEDMKGKSQFNTRS